MLRYRRAARAADVVHFQWLTVQPLDVHLLPRRRPTDSKAHPPRPKLVLTAHDVLPREPRPGQLAAQRRLYERFDAVVVHSEHGRGRLLELGVDPGRVHVIPHGALTHLADRSRRHWPSTEAGDIRLDEHPAGASGAVLRPAGRGSRGARRAAQTDRWCGFFGLRRPYEGDEVGGGHRAASVAERESSWSR